MANIDTIRDKVRFHIKDVFVQDDELDQVILQVIEDIANQTRIFKKIYGFTIHEDIQVYDFRNLARMNEQVERELSGVTIGSFNQDDIIDWMNLNTDTEWPSPEIMKTEFDENDCRDSGEEPGPNTLVLPTECNTLFIGLLDIYDAYGVSIMDMFREHGNSQYFVYDEQWLAQEDGVMKSFTASVVPDIDELLQEDLAIIMSTIIEGCKYYIANTFQAPTDSQVANLYYQRYWKKKEELSDQFPTVTYSIPDRARIKRWP